MNRFQVNRALARAERRSRGEDPRGETLLEVLDRRIRAHEETLAELRAQRRKLKTKQRTSEKTACNF